ncbi:hypothetical protein F939_02295 [Acinetobacter radioresistens DSM 6976 = NBRC 102413 = CIP 103788]|nr:hypothetical protein [Acinetobacter radioresistens]ENV87511.1 hypothetical protein F939_02295 [Acinetobacter radioresistens DSM 6976 = NBRC 102413 = CIP 103788]BBL21144.1 hypothetical protein ACRAD_18150 [Acinetobacter radioresistens DSM 6976 = NBRC 102413 = CIP 103788]
MRSVEDMAQECLLKLLPSYTANDLSAPDRENLVYVCVELAKELQTELNKLNRGTPTAILETERRKCEHCWVDATVDGSVRDCIKCGQRREEG